MTSPGYDLVKYPEMNSNTEVSRRLTACATRTNLMRVLSCVDVDEIMSRVG